MIRLHARMASGGGLVLASVVALLLLAGGLRSVAQTPPAFVTRPDQAVPGATVRPPPLPGGVAAAPATPPPQLPGGLAPAPVVAPPRVLMAGKILAHNTDLQEFLADGRKTNISGTFYFTNISGAPITITGARTNCSCTSAHIRPAPWTLAPGEQGEIRADVDISGKVGTLQKPVFLDTDKGFKVFMMKVEIPDNVFLRDINRTTARRSRQSVFIGKCGDCHATPAAGKLGEPLYQVACGICHEAEHRAQMVPDLKNLPHPTDRAFWQHWITHGKADSLMPAFAKDQGGPLDNEQIQSLADFLTTRFPSKPAGSAK